MKNAYLENDTIVAIATPSGEGAIGIVRISGPKAVEIVSSLVTLSNLKTFYTLPSQKVALGTFHQNGTRIDHVLVTVFRAPCSYTGEDIVEISCHGSPIVLKQILKLLMESGIRLAEPGEFSQRAFLNGKMDLTQVEAVADLIRSQTEFSRSIAFSQLEGHLSQQFRRIRDALMEIAVHIEVGIDHSDDISSVLAISIEEMERKIISVLQKVRDLIASYEYGRLAREGVKITIVGKPNVGKSSLLNRLLKNERAIVTTVPGTTRDTIEEGFDLLGLPAVLVDTAGIREKVFDLAEKIGVERTIKSVEKADVVIVLLDGSAELSGEDQKVAQIVEKKKVVIALNKNDLPEKISPAKVIKLFSNQPAVSISVLKNSGIEKLMREVHATVSFPGNGTKPPEREFIVTSLRHRQCLVQCEKSLVQAAVLCRENLMDECLALEVRDAVDSLGEIVGEVVTEDILKEIFSKFCIGK